MTGFEDLAEIVWSSRDVAVSPRDPAHALLGLAACVLGLVAGGWMFVRYLDRVTALDSLGRLAAPARRGGSDMAAPIRVLFVCVHNAARSRIAEAWLRALGGPRFDVTSAGFQPREIDPLVIEALPELALALQTRGPQPSVFELFRAGRHFHYVIGVCDEEHGQRCPVFPGITRRLSWSFPDPRDFAGPPGEQRAQMVALGGAIRARIEAWLETLPAEAGGAWAGR